MRTPNPLNTEPAFQQPGNRYAAPYLPGWTHGANSAASTAAAALDEYRGCWQGAPLRAEPFAPDEYIHLAIYYQDAADAQ